MEIETMVPVHTMEFNFDSTCSSPYMTAPSSPQRFGNFFYSAPTSPRRKEVVERGDIGDVTAGGVGVGGCEFEDFEFSFSGQLDKTSLSAEELFDGGKIRPLKPQQFSNNHFDPFDAAIEESRKRVILLNEPPKQKQEQLRERGRERTHNNVHKKSRSLSPFRVSDIMFETEETTSKSQKTVASNSSNPKSYVSSILSAISFPKGNRKWKLKDLLLFRSASEGRATISDDSFRKYAVLSRKEPEDVKNESFRSTDSIGSVSSSRRRGPVSAHELHYTANRAVSGEMRRKTYLPYKHGLLGCLRFNGGPRMHEISRGIGSLARG